MHPPRFRLEDNLSDWPDCFLHLYCCRFTTPSVRGFLLRVGDRPFAEIIAKLRCERCHQAPAPVYLCASHHREGCKGPAPDWAVELIAEPEHPLPFRRSILRRSLGQTDPEPAAAKKPVALLAEGE